MKRLLAHRNAFPVTDVERKGAVTSPAGKAPDGGAADWLNRVCDWVSMNMQSVRECFGKRECRGDNSVNPKNSLSACNLDTSISGQP